MNRKKIRMLVTVVLSMLVTSMSGCAGCNKNDMSVNNTPTVAVTATIAPTATVEPTKEVEPTIVPAPTDIPATPTPLPTPEPTATPIPTNTPIPTKAVSENAKLLDSVKMGDNAWYDFYNDGTLVVRGTGATRDVNADFVIDYESVMTKFYTDTEYDEKISSRCVEVNRIIIEEGITELGDWSLAGLCFTETISLPTTLNTIGYAALYGTYCKGIECSGLRTDMKIGQYALANFYLPVTDIASEFKEYAEAPALKPRPTATPIPNPDKPRKAATLDVGNNITYEFWDNGIMYVKGVGAVPTQSEMFGLDTEYHNPTGYVLAKTTHTAFIDEGITGVGQYAFIGLSATEWYLPKSLTNVHDNSLLYGTIFHGYYEGKAVTVDVTAYGRDIPYKTFIDIVKNEETALQYNAIVTW